MAHKFEEYDFDSIQEVIDKARENLDEMEKKITEARALTLVSTYYRDMDEMPKGFGNHCGVRIQEAYKHAHNMPYSSDFKSAIDNITPGWD
jgi:hypothetical protein